MLGGERAYLPTLAHLGPHGSRISLIVTLEQRTSQRRKELARPARSTHGNSDESCSVFIYWHCYHTSSVARRSAARPNSGRLHHPDLHGLSLYPQQTRRLPQHP